MSSVSGKSIQIDVKEFLSGMYFIEIKNGNEHEQIKFIKN